MEDASGNGRPHKVKSIDRIALAVASIMAVGRAAANASMSASYVGEHDGLAFCLNVGRRTQERNASRRNYALRRASMDSTRSGWPRCLPPLGQAGPFPLFSLASCFHVRVGPPQ